MPLASSPPFPNAAILGEGGMCTVYRARLPKGQEVAVKVMHERRLADPQAVRAFRREGELALKLRHPHLVRTYRAGWHKQRLVIVMEFVDGPGLDSLLGGRQWRVEDALRVTDQCLQGLQHLHELGYVHCDMKPENVRFTKAGRVKLIDFGSARSLAAAAERAPVPGTPLYMPPEQASGEPCRQPADLYSLGAVLYELLTGRPVFGGDPVSVIHHHVHTEPVAVSSLRPEVPAMVAQAIHQSLAKDPYRRFASAEAMRVALTA